MSEKISLDSSVITIIFRLSIYMNLNLLVDEHID